ncbi:unnamed protein product [Orchesella dallaii]|uniref:Uncharacterized protein n=1 Tax=Orchesella dallaii TaxID=48710 RepID=A0ABP1RKW1_9HEXA
MNSAIKLICVVAVLVTAFILIAWVTAPQGKVEAWLLTKFNFSLTVAKPSAATYAPSSDELNQDMDLEVSPTPDERGLGGC